MYPPAFFRHVALLALGVLFPAVLHAADDGPGFRRFAGSISPDGAWVFAWGWGEEEQPQQLAEWPAGRDTAGYSVANYLVDAVRGQVVKRIPEHDHFQTSEGRWKLFSGLAVGWSEDSQQALAIYAGRWSDDSIIWVNAKQRTFTEVLPLLDKACRRFFAKEEKLKDAGEITFGMPALLPGGVLVIDAWARPRVNESPEYKCRLKFVVKTDGAKPKCALVGGRKIAGVPGGEKVEDEMNKAYQQVRAKLNDAGREALRERQLRWLAQREALDKSEREFFTRLRTASLRAQAEN